MFLIHKRQRTSDAEENFRELQTISDDVFGASALKTLMIRALSLKHTQIIFSKIITILNTRLLHSRLRMLHPPGNHRLNRQKQLLSVTVLFSFKLNYGPRTIYTIIQLSDRKSTLMLSMIQKLN